MEIFLLSFTKKEIVRLLAGLLLGAILGAAALNLILSHTMDSLIYEKNKLAQDLEIERERIEKLEQAIESGYRGIVREIKVDLEFPGDKHTNQLLVTEIRKLLGGLVGRELAEDDAFLVRDVLNRRIISLDGQNYVLDFLFFIFVDGRLSVYLHAVKTNKQTDPRD
ncbi:MAG: hypothetical protein UMV23_01855 [Halanaerobium sp.]|nr:hypothetical protein [Halanaerobium sp.]